METKFIISRLGKFNTSMNKDTPNIVIGQYVIIPKRPFDYAMTTSLSVNNTNQYQTNGQKKFAHL